MVLNSAEDVSSALTTVRQAGCKFAVRTSGHNPNVGFSSVDGTGVVLDLSGLTRMSLDGEAGVLRAGPGNRWGPVYSLLQEHGLSPVGGRDVQVGLGGFLTGGPSVRPSSLPSKSLFERTTTPEIDHDG